MWIWRFVNMLRGLGHPWHINLMLRVFLSLGSIFIYNMPTNLQTWQIHISGPLQGPKAPFKGPGGPLTYQSYDKMCCNEFSYHCDQFWYVKCQQTFKLDKFTFQNNGQILSMSGKLPILWYYIKSKPPGGSPRFLSCKLLEPSRSLIIH